MKIAIIGGGISGLTAAYRLQGRHEITLFEANDYVGGHTHTHAVEVDGQNYTLDTGFIVFNDRTYPNFCKLLSELDVASQASDMSFSVRCDASGLEYSGGSLNGLFAQRRNLLRPAFYRLWFDFARFGRQAPQERDETLTVGRYLARERYSKQFIEQYFLPMGSAVWSCPRGAFAEFPLRFIVDFYLNHGLLSVTDRPQWRVIRGGSQSYVQALTRDFAARIRLNTPVAHVLRAPDYVEVSTERGSALGATAEARTADRFDHVIFGCHADQALRILGAGATSVERDVLSAFPYERNEALLHTDTSVLPRQRRAWASWNYHLPAQDTGKSTVTYNLNMLQSIPGPRVFCVTLNGAERINPRLVIRRMHYEHPVFDMRRTAAKARHAELLNRNRSSFCGAYWGNGFHEDGVVSALAVCRELDIHSVESGSAAGHSPAGESCTVASTKVSSDIGGSGPSSTNFDIASS